MNHYLTLGIKMAQNRPKMDQKYIKNGLELNRNRPEILKYVVYFTQSHTMAMNYWVVSSDFFPPQTMF